VLEFSAGEQTVTHTNGDGENRYQQNKGNKLVVDTAVTFHYHSLQIYSICRFLYHIHIKWQGLYTPFFLAFPYLST
jgi:hypothetical protein